MQKMIKAYEKARLLVQCRIHELDEALRDEHLMNRERERLTERRDMLAAESIAMLHIIADLYAHLQ